MQSAGGPAILRPALLRSSLDQEIRGMGLQGDRGAGGALEMPDMPTQSHLYGDRGRKDVRVPPRPRTMANAGRVRKWDCTHCQQPTEIVYVGWDRDRKAYEFFCRRCLRTYYVWNNQHEKERWLMGQAVKASAEADDEEGSAGLDGQPAVAERERGRCLEDFC